MLAVTGANGHLGCRLLETVVGDEGGSARALVRSARAEARVRGLALGETLDVQQVDYHDVDGLAAALTGCEAVVHLVGIIKESAGNRYRDAHQRACEALVLAAGRAGVRRIVYLSIVGAAADSANACLASRGEAERILFQSGVPATDSSSVPVTVIRVPMVLGEDDFAARALATRARRGWNVVLRGESLEQPIYAGDVVAAVLAALAAEGGSHRYDLGGPESLSRTALIHRAARLLGRRTRVLSLPLGPGLAMAWMLETLMPRPPVTRAMLGVLDHDDHINPQPALQALGLELLPLDETLRRCLAAAPVEAS